jgi:hypothetical protein
MARGGKNFRQQDERPRELQRFGPLACGRDSAKPGLHRNYVAPRAARAASGFRAAERSHQRGAKKEGPLSGALSRYGVNHPGLSQQHARHLGQPPGFPEENLCRYFFFFLPAFFFILVFSLGLDFLAELFFFTGIDTLLNSCCCRTSSRNLLSLWRGRDLAFRMDYRNLFSQNQAER